MFTNIYPFTYFHPSLALHPFLPIIFWGLRRCAAALRYAARWRSAPAGLAATAATAPHR